MPNPILDAFRKVTPNVPPRTFLVEALDALTGRGFQPPSVLSLKGASERSLFARSYQLSPADRESSDADGIPTIAIRIRARL